MLMFSTSLLEVVELGKVKIFPDVHTVFFINLDKSLIACTVSKTSSFNSFLPNPASSKEKFEKFVVDSEPFYSDYSIFQIEKSNNEKTFLTIFYSIYIFRTIFGENPDFFYRLR